MKGGIIFINNFMNIFWSIKFFIDFVIRFIFYFIVWWIVFLSVLRMFVVGLNFCRFFISGWSFLDIIIFRMRKDFVRVRGVFYIRIGKWYSFLVWKNFFSIDVRIIRVFKIFFFNICRICVRFYVNYRYEFFSYFYLVIVEKIFFVFYNF